MLISRKETMRALRESRYILGQVPCGSVQSSALTGMGDGGLSLFYGGKEHFARPAYLIVVVFQHMNICTHLSLLLIFFSLVQLLQTDSQTFQNCNTCPWPVQFSTEPIMFGSAAPPRSATYRRQSTVFHGKFLTVAPCPRFLFSSQDRPPAQWYPATTFFVRSRAATFAIPDRSIKRLYGVPCTSVH
jgi:hypothetical protein